MNKFKNAEKFAAWALSKTQEKVDFELIECDGVNYREHAKLWRGNIGKKASKIYAEIGAGRVYLVNDEMRQVWIENTAKYCSEYGKLMVGQIEYKAA